MEFWKMNGAGNDFIIINGIKENLQTKCLPALARLLCERHLSIGADGLMIVDKTDSASADFKMRFYNSNGSEGEMCGNGARCICRYGYENGLSGETQKIETVAGIVTGKRITDSMYRIRLNDPCNLRIDEEAMIDGKSYRYSYVELGNPGIPHAVVEIPKLNAFPKDKLFELGRKLRYWSGFPKGANINFFDITDTDSLDEITYERGVEDFTYACGTGSGAVATILTLQGRVSGKAVRIHVRGGLLELDILRDSDSITDIFLTGSTNIVAKGTVTDSNLSTILN